MTNEFSENLSLNDVKARYDAQCKRVLSQKELHMSDQLGKEMHLMCNLSDLVEEHGNSAGNETWSPEEFSGEENMAWKKKPGNCKKLLKLGTMSEEEILQVTEISKEQLDKIKETL